ncbi:Chitin-inducible gibberellin-responsive protein 1 [Spatholobus suberectus]|nr:Chitin-inducible gibberellin-responsive protein 1 [Spatholobus suberectus]
MEEASLQGFPPNNLKQLLISCANALSENNMKEFDQLKHAETRTAIHIIDFQIAQGTQWITLLQALVARLSGAPYVGTMGIDDPISNYTRNGGLDVVGKRLALMSEKFVILVEFHGMPIFKLVLS